MFCKPSHADMLARSVQRGNGRPLQSFAEAPGLGAIDWNGLVQAIPGVLETGAKVYGSIEAGKYNPLATYNVPYGVTPSAVGVSWGGGINANTQGFPPPLPSSLSSLLPYLLAGGAVLGVMLMMRR